MKFIRTEEQKKKHNIESKLRGQLYRQKLLEIKRQIGCSLCEETEPCCLDFHHVDPKKKLCSVSRSYMSDKRLREEIAKCIVLCANCHRKLHANVVVL